MVDKSFEFTDLRVWIFWSIKHTHNIEYKMYLQIKETARLWVFVDFSNKRSFEKIYIKLICKMKLSKWITKRSSRQEVFCKKQVFLKFHQIHKKTCFKVSFLIIETSTQVFSSEFCEIFKNTFIIEHLWRLLLYKRLIFVDFCNKKKF